MKIGFINEFKSNIGDTYDMVNRLIVDDPKDCYVSSSIRARNGGWNSYYKIDGSSDREKLLENQKGLRKWCEDIDRRYDKIVVNVVYHKNMTDRKLEKKFEKFLRDELVVTNFSSALVAYSDYFIARYFWKKAVYIVNDPLFKPYWSDRCYYFGYLEGCRFSDIMMYKAFLCNREEGLEGILGWEKEYSVYNINTYSDNNIKEEGQISRGEFFRNIRNKLDNKIEGIEIHLVNKQDREDMKQIVGYSEYMERISRSRYTMIFPAYMVSDISYMRMFEALTRKCLPIFYGCNMDVFNHVYTEFREVFNKLVLDDISKLGEFVEGLDYEALLNEIKSIPKYRELNDIGYYKKELERLLNF